MHKLMASILLKQRAKYSFISHASYLTDCSWMSLAGVQSVALFQPSAKALCGESNTLTWLRDRGRGWGCLQNLLENCCWCGKELLMPCTGQLGRGQDDGEQSCATVWLREQSLVLWVKGVARRGLWGGGESPVSHLFCFPVSCEALPWEDCAVAVYPAVCIPCLGTKVGASVYCWVCCRWSVLVVLAAFAEGTASLGGAKSEVFAEPRN